jgi:hypothetical protein
MSYVAQTQSFIIQKSYANDVITENCGFLFSSFQYFRQVTTFFKALHIMHTYMTEKCKDENNYTTYLQTEVLLAAVYHVS